MPGIFRPSVNLVQFSSVVDQRGEEKRTALWRHLFLVVPLIVPLRILSIEYNALHYCLTNLILHYL